MATSPARWQPALIATLIFGVGVGVSLALTPQGDIASVSSAATLIAAVVTLAWIVPLIPSFPTQRDRVGWLLITLSVFVLLFTSTFWAGGLIWKNNFLRDPGYHVLLILGNLLLWAGLIYRPGQFPRDPVSRLVSLCDVFVAFGATYVLTNDAFLTRGILLLNIPFLTRSNLALITLVILIGMLHRAIPRQLQGPRALLGLGIGMVLAEDVGLGALVGKGGEPVMPVFAMLWPVGIMLYGVAARWESFVARQLAKDEREVDPLPSLAGMLVPTVMLVAAMFVATQDALASSDSDRAHVVLFSMTILLVLVMIRQVVAFEKDRQHYQQLQDLYKITAREAITDQLTGLVNQRYFRDHFEIELRRARRYRRPIAIIFCDLDHFKSINDTFGHPVGDLALQAVADTLCRQVREMDLVARYGGEEFVVMLPETTLAQAEAMAERLRKGVAALSIPLPGGGVQRVTMSFGVAAHPDTAETVEELLANADAAMYHAKAAGRNCVMSAVTPVESTRKSTP